MFSWKIFATSFRTGRGAVWTGQTGQGQDAASTSPSKVQIRWRPSTASFAIASALSASPATRHSSARSMAGYLAKPGADISMGLGRTSQCSPAGVCYGCHRQSLRRERHASPHPAGCPPRLPSEWPEADHVLPAARVADGEGPTRHLRHPSGACVTRKVPRHRNPRALIISMMVRPNRNTLNVIRMIAPVEFRSQRPMRLRRRRVSRRHQRRLGWPRGGGVLGAGLLTGAGCPGPETTPRR